MGLNLSSVVYAPSQVLGAYIPTRLDNGISLAEAKQVVAYLQTLPGATVTLKILAYSNEGMAPPVDVPWLEMNTRGNPDQPLQLTIEGTIELPQRRFGPSPVGLDRVSKPITDLAANLGRSLSGHLGRSGWETFLSTFGFTPAEIELYMISLPEVQTAINKTFAGV